MVLQNCVHLLLEGVLLSRYPLRESRWCNEWLSGCPHSGGCCECVASILASSADLGAIVSESLGGDACSEWLLGSSWSTANRRLRGLYETGADLYAVLEEWQP